MGFYVDKPMPKVCAACMFCEYDDYPDPLVYGYKCKLLRQKILKAESGRDEKCPLIEIEKPKNQ